MKIIDLSENRESKIVLKKNVMYRELDSWIEINASITEVWDRLVDFKSWGNWNSFIPMVEGNFEVGSNVSIKVVSPGMKEMRFKPVIFEIEPKKRISWGGGFLIFVYNGVHEFLLEYVEKNITIFRQIEKFKGPITLLMNKMILKTATGYQNMNEEFKEYIEGKLTIKYAQKANA